jgi:hypothetical protein
MHADGRRIVQCVLLSVRGGGGRHAAQWGKKKCTHNFGSKN